MNRAIPPSCKADLKKAQQLEKQKLLDPSVTVSLIQLYDQILTRFSSNQFPLFYSFIKSKLGNAYWRLPTGDRITNLEFTIACYQEALRFWTPKTAALDYARMQYNLGIVYYKLSELRMGDRIANLRRAIACYQEALHFWTPKTAALDYASTQYSLGRAYSDLGELPTQDRIANLQYTVACYQEALRFWPLKTAALDYANTHNSLGIVYCKLSALSMDDRIANLKSAIIHFQQVLHFWTPKTAALDYAGVQKNLGMAYYDLSKLGDRTANLERAIACYQEALRFQTPETAPLDYAGTQNSLGNIYYDHSKLLLGDRTANLERAIACYQEALRFQTPETAPFSYAKTQHNLGNAYCDLLAGNRIANLERAIACYQEALRFQTPETAPLSYAGTQNNLGVAYQNLSEQPTAIQNFYANVQNLGTASYEVSEHLTRLRVGSLEHIITDILNNPDAVFRDLSKQQTQDRIANLKRAIACYQEALRFYTPETAPFDYARTQTSLGTLYRDLSKQQAEDRTINLERALACHREALRFYTPETAPLGYANVQNNMGAAYQDLSELPKEDHINLERALTCYQEALRFQTPEANPIECRRVTSNIAYLYFMLRDWKTALSYFRAAIDVGERLYQAGLFIASKATEIAENAALYQRAAFSAARCGKPTEALLLLEQGKTRLLTEALRLHVARPDYVPDSVWRTFKDADAALRAAQAQEMTVFEGERLHGEANKGREQVIQVTNTALDTAIQQVRLYAPHFLKTLALEEIQSLVSEIHTALIAFCLTEHGSMGIITGHQGKNVEVVEIPTFTLADLNRLFITQSDEGEFAKGWFGSYQYYQVQQSPEAFKVWQETMTHTLETLGQELLWDLLSRLPPNITQITFLPANLLFLFPLHAVPLSSGSAQRVCDRYQVSYAPSIEVLTNIKVKATRDVVPHLYAVINPEADPQLVFTAVEGQAIARLFSHVHMDEGRAGTKDNVVIGICENSYLHFSCHSSYNWLDPTASGISLADGFLTLAELQQGVVDLSGARLLTLSACETGIIDVIQGSPEEYVGLPAGFLVAGVPCVVSSLWEVPDLSTALLMGRFYHNHLREGLDFAAALREAQVWLRLVTVEEVTQYLEQQYQRSQQREKIALFKPLRYYRSLTKRDPTLHPFVHPYYWAAFTVHGL